jgi:hypothetical protein
LSCDSVQAVEGERLVCEIAALLVIQARKRGGQGDRQRERERERKKEKERETEKKRGNKSCCKQRSALGSIEILFDIGYFFNKTI